MTRTIEEAVISNISILSDPIKELSRDYGSVAVGEITVDHIVKRGLRRVPTLVSNVSSVDPITGQKLRDTPIREFSKSHSMIQAFWYGMTGEYGSPEELSLLKAELQIESKISPQIHRFIRKVTKNHPEVSPMTILSATFAMVPEEESHFYICKTEGKRGKELVRAAVLDSKRIFAQSVGIVGMIYSLKYGDKEIREPLFDETKSWGANLAYAMGLSPEYADHLEKVGLVHVAQGKGNVSSHTSHLVGSMGANPYKCISTCVTALSSPGHAKASTDAMEFIDTIILKYGESPKASEVESFLTDWLNQKRKIPGIGQAVMQNVDPRFMELYEFAEKTPKIKIAEAIRIAVPRALENAGVKLNSPNPNVNLILGSFAESVGIKEKAFFPVLFTVGRLMDPLSQFVENIIWNSTMLRPESLTTEELLTLAKKARDKSSDKEMVRGTIERFKGRGSELHESLIVNLLNHLPEDQVDLYGRAIIDRLSLYKEDGGREFYRVDIRSRAALSANAIITFSDVDGNIHLALAKKWKDPRDHDKGTHSDYQNIGGYMNTIISRALKRIVSSDMSHQKEQAILKGSVAADVYSKEFWDSMTPEKFIDYLHDEDLTTCLYREIKEETSLEIPKKCVPKLVSSVVKHRSRGDLSLLINYYSLHLGKIGEPPRIIPGDDVAQVDFVNSSSIKKIIDSSGNPSFYVENADSTTLIERNNAIEYEKAIKIVRDTDFKERFNMSIGEFITFAISVGESDIIEESAPRGEDVFGEESSKEYQCFIKASEEIAQKHAHTFKLLQSRQEMSKTPFIRSKL